MATTQTLTAPRIFAPQTSPTGPVAPLDRTRIYKEYLTPALHRRFVSAASFLLVFCWVEAFILSSSSHIFWSWFPIGVAGLRTLLLFGPCLAVYIVRVANIHVGRRTTTSGAETVYSHLLGAKDLRITTSTLGWYVWSGWFFGEVYIWSRSARAELGWVDPSRHAWEKPQLNENPVFLRCLFVLLGVAQAVMHLARGYDRITIPMEQGEKAQQTVKVVTSQIGQSDSPTSKLPRPLQELSDRAGTIVNHAIKLTLSGVLFITIPSYFLLLRRPAWSWSYTIGRALNHQLPPSAPPSGLLHVPRLSYQAFSASFLLAVLWEVSNALFDIFVVQPPMRREQPLTNEVKDSRGVVLQKSKDPNASLITGLRSKKEVPKSFAFWELYIICTQFDQRRKTIYVEVDRKGGSTWEQVFNHCTVEIEQVRDRIINANKPAQHGPEPNVASAGGNQQDALRLPKIADQSVKNDGQVFVQRKVDFAQKVGNTTKSWGQSPGARDPITPRARKALEWSTDRMLTRDQQARLTRDGFKREASSWSTEFLKSPLGEPFRQTFARKATEVIFGAPFSDQANIVHAAQSLAKLAICSLKEDDYGQVAKDVPKIVRIFTDVIRLTESFTQTLSPSWTDVTFTDRDRSIAEIQSFLDILKRCLEEVILAFGEYAGGLGLSKKEVREAREAAARNPAFVSEMSEMHR